MRNKWIYTIVVLALGLFASCSDHMDEPGTDGKGRKVVFRLSVNDANAGSRAAWSENYMSSDAEGIENYINPNSLQVVVYEGTTYRGKASNVLSWPATSGDAEYQFVGDLSKLNLVSGNSYQFMVFANCADVSNTTQLSRLPYDISELQNAIPMWGVKKVTLTNDELQDIETIDLLRAAAKIEVDLKVELDGNQVDNSPMKDYTLEYVSVKPYNTRGYSAPSGVNSNVEGTTQLDQEGCFNPHTSLAENANGYKPLPFTVTDDGKRAIVYVPEYDNKHTSSDATTISVTLTKDGKTFYYEDAIGFYEYSGGKPIASAGKEYDIIRNHHYKFTITGVSGGLEIQYAVMDWEDADETNLLTYEYPTYHNPLLPEVPTDNNKVNIDKSPTMYYKAPTSGETVNEEGAFVAYFKMTAPQEKTWTPTFKASQSDYAVRVYDHSGTTLKYSTIESDNKSEATDLIAADSWYMIKVIPLNNEKVNEVVNLGITYQITNTSTPFYLFVNGTAENDIRWPNSGNDPKFIQIEQVAEPSGTNTNP